MLNIVDPEKGNTSFNYDTLGREIKKVMANGLITETIYDAAERVTAIKNYRGNGKCFWHDGVTGEANANRNLNTDFYTMPDQSPDSREATGTQSNNTRSTNTIKERGFGDIETVKTKTVFTNTEYGHDMTGKSYAYLYNDAGERTFQVDEEGNVSAYHYDEAARIANAAYPFRSNKKIEDFREKLYLGLYPDCDIIQGDKNEFVFDLPKINMPYYKNEDFENSLKDVFNDNDEFYKSYKKLDGKHFPRWKVSKGQYATDFITRENHHLWWWSTSVLAGGDSGFARIFPQ